jgi:hypothetical protein
MERLEIFHPLRQRRVQPLGQSAELREGLRFAFPRRQKTVAELLPAGEKIASERGGFAGDVDRDVGLASAGQLGYLRDLGPKPGDAAPDQGWNDQDGEEEDHHEHGQSPALPRGNQSSFGFSDFAGHRFRSATDGEFVGGHSYVAL